MNVFNRVLIILLDLLLLVVTSAVLLVSFGLARPEQLAPTSWWQDRLVPFTQLAFATWGWTVGICGALFLLGLLLLFFELRPPPREAPQLVLKQDGLGRVTVTRDGVRELVGREAGRVAGVMEVRPRVEENSKGMRILCRTSVDPTANMPELTREVQERVKAAVEHHLGRQVAEVRVDAQLEPLDGPGRRARRVR
jgi:hypothetical protein